MKEFCINKSKFENIAICSAIGLFVIGMLTLYMTTTYEIDSINIEVTTENGLRVVDISYKSFWDNKLYNESYYNSSDFKKHPITYNIFFYNVLSLVSLLMSSPFIAGVIYEKQQKFKFAWCKQ